MALVLHYLPCYISNLHDDKTSPTTNTTATMASSSLSTDAPIVTESTYSDGKLAWGVYTIEDNDLITVVEDKAGYNVLSLNELELRITPASILPKEFLDQWLYTGLPAYLQEEVYILVSIQSGTGLAEKFLDVLLPVLDAVGVKRTVVSTTSAESVKDFVKGTLLPAANDGNKQTVIMLSGDGGVVDSINSLGERSQYVLLHPMAFLTIAESTQNLLLPSFHSELEMPSSILSTNFLPFRPSTFKV